jgi:AcrR family transcriptional regulator
MTTTRKRLHPTESRSVALEAARDILLSDGPQAVTLKAVAARIGRTHANLLHHFESAFELQKALMAMLAEGVCQTIGAVVLQARQNEADFRQIVDMTFDAFNSQGAGALALWMITSGNRDALDPILTAIHNLVDELADDGHDDRPIHEDTLALVLMALGDALLGQPMADAFGLPHKTAREIALRQLLASPRVQSRLVQS